MIKPKPPWAVEIALENGWTLEELDGMTCEELVRELYEAGLLCTAEEMEGG